MYKNKPILSLVGAGPGDPEYITIKSINIIKAADVILYDALVNEEILEYARPEAIVRFAGKRMGCHYLSQQEINQLIVEYARCYRRIVRLKGGDSFVFGRAQEEIEVARAAGMDVEVVPGISSVMAVPASKMIPLTCRGINESFWVVTGITRSGELSADIELAARSSATIILLMGMSKLEVIMDIFARAGKGDVPVAIIQDGTTSRERAVRGTVRDIYIRSREAALGSPAIIIIGKVVNFSHAFETGVPVN